MKEEKKKARMLFFSLLGTDINKNEIAFMTQQFRYFEMAS